ncbi:CMGC/CDK protein kinase [Aphanomyces invadans]|uniref:Cyclin-dependent kinase 2 homolog n=1 Tax=Aphanomyces invadans TaxID=157072 RepID=A0A024UAE1_9STRA|nr:CMGC/CDK protein kinase [Aphanomyces invadans]ETW02588.1 CMGC/CDK protein kinase [Aphanomyces invadans]|eukprot:XP_008869193.1 CMGC/CDK protein kinase [Aphanomyces invadans]
MGEFDSDDEEQAVVGHYTLHEEIGRGTYGVVYEARHNVSGNKVAIKRLLPRHDASSSDEVGVMQRLAGAPHILQLQEVLHEQYQHEPTTFIVSEFMESDLETVIRATDALPQLSLPQIKSYLRMTIQGLAECHARHIIHRDVKPNNILLGSNGNAMLADFGMAVVVPELAARATSTWTLSFQVVTRAYRAPELLFGLKQYDTSVDMWAVGCLFGELFLRRVWFDGASDIDQLNRIFRALGSPDEQHWSAAKTLPFFLEFAPTSPPSLVTQFPTLPATGIDLLSKLLRLDPTARISAADALAHPFFAESPLALDAALLPMVTPPERGRKRRASSLEDEHGDAAEDVGDVPMKGRRLF